MLLIVTTARPITACTVIESQQLSTTAQQGGCWDDLRLRKMQVNRAHVEPNTCFLSKLNPLKMCNLLMALNSSVLQFLRMWNKNSTPLHTGKNIEVGSLRGFRKAPSIHSSKYSIEQWFSTRDDVDTLHPPLPGKGTFVNVWRYVGCHSGEQRGCSWHLVSRGHGCCYTTYNVRDSPPQQSIMGPISIVLRLRTPAVDVGYLAI